MTLSNPVAITLGSDDYELKPSLKAAQNVSNRFNGFQNAIAAVAGNDLSAVTYVIRQGIPLKQISNDDLNEAVYAAGTRNLIGDVMKYVVRLSNGGRDPDLEDADGNEDRDEGNGEV